jgi:hypothetical protein
VKLRGERIGGLVRLQGAFVLTQQGGDPVQVFGRGTHAGQANAGGLHHQPRLHQLESSRIGDEQAEQLWAEYLGGLGLADERAAARA